MRYFRGFGSSDGNIVGGDIGVQSRLIDQSQSVAGSHDEHSIESCDSHVTDDDDDVISESDQSGRLIWVAVRLLNKTIRKQFYTSQTIKVCIQDIICLGHLIRTS